MKELREIRKARGAFYTPSEISRFIVNWAVRSSEDKILEPSCGEASFLLEAGERIKELGGALKNTTEHLHGIEIDYNTAITAANNLSNRGLGSDIKIQDFFEFPAERRYDVIVGNPPFVRYQSFSGRARIKAAESALKHGVRLTGLANSWAAFVIYSAQLLNSGGRLGMVLPAELLTVNYASEVRRFLLNRFNRVQLVMFEERVFPDVLQDVILLMAEGRGPACNFKVYQARNLSDLLQFDANKWSRFIPEKDGKWSGALVPAHVFSVYQDIVKSKEFSKLANWGETYLGSVTGNNKFFALNKTDIEYFGLSHCDVRPISPPGSRHLNALKFSKATWASLVKENARAYLFVPREGQLSHNATRYIRYGEAQGINVGYKCRNRHPWWRVPLVEIPDLLLTYMDHNRPRFVENHANVDILNSVYGVKLYKDLVRLGRRTLPLSSLNSVTLLGAEIVGRAYGGGLLKLEPKEAGLLPMPAPELVASVERHLELIKPQLAVPLRKGDLGAAVELVDRVVLQKSLDMSVDILSQLSAARKLLFERRLARGKRNGGTS